ncbi:unnamed protein product [Medioppia subpectinata]|uniref:Small RNA 2'-O-methyltransferase n=1 Tax=Medioppia subpectinata TaxID=1979941 RepID=A0A7R9KEJ1_9ACAR|nr:unnamed protein product [Medioppia subpectinata]CAG2101878.1 unnamed protein product [Medioppia subpectinata]
MKSEDENQISGSDVVFNPPLYIQRYQFVFDVLSERSATIAKVADFGCAEGKLMRRFKGLPDIEEIAFIDCDDLSLEMCVNECRPLPYDYLFAERKTPMKVNVFNGSVAQKDSRLKNFDAITCVELIEHLTPDVLTALPDNIFGYIEPKVVIITTPNVEYNVVFPQLKDSSRLRHWDHKFEWTRHEFDNWCRSVVEKYPEYKHSNPTRSRVYRLAFSLQFN